MGRALAAAALVVLSFGLLAPHTHAQVPFNGAYSQNFNALPSSGTPTWVQNSTLPGWYAYAGASGTPTFLVGTGSGNQGAVYSFGASSGNALADRALGSVASNSTTYYYAVVLQNSTATTITSVNLQFTGEQWRVGNTTNTQTNLIFGYRTIAAGSITASTITGGTYTVNAPTNFGSPITTGTVGALDGNAATSRIAYSATLSGLTWTAGDYLILRWFDTDDTDADHGLAIDNVAVFQPGQLLVADTNAIAATLDGALTSANEYGPGNQFRWNGDGTSFGNAVGNGSVYMKSDASNLYVAFQAGAGFADTIVILLDTGSASPATYPPNPGNVSTQNAVTRMLNNSTVLPSGFRASYAIALDGSARGNINRFYTITSASVNDNAGFSASGTGSATGDIREFSIPFSTLGISASSTVKFVVSQSNPNQSNGAAFLSSESIPPSPTLNGNNQPGQSGGTFNQAGRFITFGCAAVTVGTQPTQNTNPVCLSSPITYTVAGSGGSGSYTYQWKQSTDNFVANDVNATGTSTSASYTPSTSTAGTMYYRCIVSSTCGSPSSATSNTVTLTVNAAPAVPTGVSATATSYCSGSAPATITLSATPGSGGTDVQWFTGSCGGTSIGTNTSLVLSAPAVTTTYFARTVDAAGCVSTTCGSVTVTVSASPNPGVSVTAASSSVCIGSETTINISPSQGGVSYQLRDDADDSPIGSPVNGSGFNISLPTGPLTGTKTFNVLATRAGCTPVELTTRPTVTAASQPANPNLAVSSVASSVCPNVPTFVTVANSEVGVSYMLRIGTTAASGVVTGNGGTINLSIGFITTTTTFNVLATVPGCSAVQLAQTVTITVNPNPATPTATTSYNVFAGTPLTISATVGPGETVDWYGGNCGSGQVFATGQTSLTIPSVASGTTQYFARARNTTTGCISPLCLTISVVGSGQVVISQVYGGGGNTGASYRNDFVELFNRGTTSVNLAGWTIQYASDTGAFNASAALSGSIAPGSYYLVVLQSGGAVGNLLPPGDVTNTGINMGGAGGKVALANTSATVTSPSSSNVVDFVGYGSATSFEGSASTAAPSNTLAVFRIFNGCTETNQNSADFATGTPRPRNSASAICNCAGGLTQTITDTTATGATLSGGISSDEYGGTNNPYQFGGDGGSFGGMLGYFANSTTDPNRVLKPRVFMDSSASELIIGVRSGAQLTNDNTIAILLDTHAGGSTSSPTFSDNGDAGRSAASRALRSARPPTFGVDYVLIVYAPSGGANTDSTLFSFNGTALSPVSGTASSGSNAATVGVAEISIPYSAIGFTAGANIDFIATLSNGVTTGSGSTMSDETIPVTPALTGAGNQGTSGGTFTNYNRFITFCPAPIASLSVTPTDASVCANGSTTITLAGSETGVSYQLRSGISPVPGVPAQVGTGGTLTFSTGSLSSTTTFNLLATKTSPCSGSVQLTQTATVSVVQPPTASLSVSATSSAVCPGGSTSITISASETGVSYQLWSGGSPIGAAQIGNGGTLSFGTSSINSITTFSIVATSAPCTPPITLAQTATVSLSPVTSTSNPSASSQCFGFTTTFSAMAGGTGPFAYQWEQSTNAGNTWGPASGTNTTSDTMTTSAAAVDGTLFRCVVTGACDSATSNPATLTVNTGPAIFLFTASPSDTLCTGGSVTFTAGATGTAPFTYTFKKNGSPVQTGASSTYTIASASVGDAASYSVEITNLCGFANSTPIALTVNTSPAITSFTVTPSDTICAGTSVTFAAASAGAGPLTYTFKKDGYTVQSGPSTSFTIASAAAGDGGSYTVEVSNTCGSTSAGPTLLTINPITTIAAQPQSQTACAGGSVTFTVTAAGTGPFSYQWRKDNAPILNQTASSYTISSLTAGDSATYDVLVTGTCGANPVTSDPAVLTVNAAAITSQPPSTASQCAGYSTSFGLIASGASPTYLWEQSTSNGITWAPAAGVNTNATYTTDPAAADQTLFRCQVTGDCGNATSNTVTLSVATSTFTATVQLQGVAASTFTRCITFDFYTAATCPNIAFSSQQSVTFTGGVGTAVISSIPCDTYSAVSARDPLHTLRRVGAGLPIFDTSNPSQLVATFTTATDGVLRNGNLNHDAYIDILDFGGYIGQSGQFVGASTGCAIAGIHADFSGDGTVGTEDFTFIQSNFLAVSDGAPCSGPLADTHPVVDISVAELVVRGEWEVARGDLNRDGRLNAADIAFLAANGLNTCPANFNGLGPTDVQDIFAFLSAWFEGHPAADINRDGGLSVPDVFEFMAMWFAGC